MRKLIDTLAILSFLVSASVVGGGVYLYTQKDALIEKARDRVTEEITGIVTNALGDGVAGILGGGSDLPIPSSGGGGLIPTPGSPTGTGIPMPF